MVSALYVLDENADPIISRQYTLDISTHSIISNFKKTISSNYNLPPILNRDGVNYIYIQVNNVYLLAVSISNANAMSIITFLNKFIDILKNYFTEITKDLFIDNYNFIYELFDEVIDFGIIQNTDINILRELIKLKINKDEKEEKPKKATKSDKSDKSDEINTINPSILRTSINKINWRQKGIFYSKNEFFIDFIEKIEFSYNLSTNKIIKNQINGCLNIKSYLSGMPVLKLGLNDKLSQLKNLNFHQCVELSTFQLNKLIKFIPPDLKSNLLTYNSTSRSKPIIMVNPIFKIFTESKKVQILVKLNTNFKKKLQLKKLVIKIPINLNCQIDFNESLKFKSELGSVEFKVDEYCIVWKIDSINGMKEIKMISELKLLNLDTLFKNGTELNLDMRAEDTEDELDEEELDNFYKKNYDKNSAISKIIKESKINFSNYLISCKFTLSSFTYSGLKISYLKIEELQLNYTSFPWVKYSIEISEYNFKMSSNCYEVIND